MTEAVAEFGIERQAVRREVWPGFLLATVLLVSLVIFAQLAIVIWLSFVSGDPGDLTASIGLQNYAKVFGDSFTFTAVVNTLGFAATSLIVALMFGLPSAWLAERSDIPGKVLLVSLMTIGLLVPGFISAMGWLFLLHTKIGLLNVLLDRTAGFRLGITNIWGMGWVEGLNLAPLAFIMTAANFRAMDPVLEEAAAMSGARPLRTWFRVTLRLAWPGILAASIYIFTIGFAAFDVPAIIGWSARTYTFSTYLLSLLNANEALPEYGTPAALSTIVIAIAALLGWWYSRIQRDARKYAVISGKAYRPRLIRLGRWRWAAWVFLGLFFLLSKLMPLIVLIWASLLPYLMVPSAEAFSQISLANFGRSDWDLNWRAIGNTAVLAVLAPSITLLVSFAFSWIVLRTRIRGRGLFDFVAFLPHAVPGVVFGMGTLLLTLYLLDRIVPLYGMIWILLLVLVIGRVSYGTRMTNTGLIQIDRELDESAHMSGATQWGVCRKVLFPLLQSTMVYSWIWIALMTCREMTLSVFLTTYDNMTLPVLIWSHWAGGNQGAAATLSLVMIVLVTPIAVLFSALVARRRLATSV